MFSTARRTVAAVAALGALALGGSALADAASNELVHVRVVHDAAAAAAGLRHAALGARPAGRGGRPRPAATSAPTARPSRPLTGDVAAKVKAAALAKVPGGTVERVETDVDHGSPYEAHVTQVRRHRSSRSSSTRSFEVTAVNTMGR